MTEPADGPERLARLAAALKGSYRVEHEIGAGGMATVYAAHDLRHDRAVAIKVLSPDFASAVGAHRFLSEIHTTARLNHPNILPLFDSGEADGLLFFVMPLMVGETLRKRMDRDPPMSTNEVLALAEEICSALAHAHRHGVIHRDIKPENILLQDGRAVLADFGIALIAGPADQRVTKTGAAVGTPAYMSPEQVLGERTSDARSDVYSVGTVLYEMLTGVPPFTGATTQAVVAKTLTEPAAPPSRRRSGISPALDAAVLAALEKDPARRPATIEALCDMLTGARQASRPRRSSRRVTLMLTGVGMAVLVTLGLAFAIWQRATAASPVLAILPFTNVTGDTTNTALGEGLPLAIFDALRPLRLNVIPVETSSDMTQNLATESISSIGHRLHASALLLGKFELDGGRTRIHVQLVDVAKGSVLWSNQFNGGANLFDLEDSVAVGVANAMRMTLNDSQRAALHATPTETPEVHRVVVRALGYIDRRDDESMHAGVDLLREALVMDSTYAPAWAALARAHTLIAVYGDSAGASNFSAADRAVDHALRLDGTLAGAHLTKAILGVFYTHNYPAAAGEFERAISLDPTDASTRLFRTWYYFAVDQPDSALMSIRIARKLDPNSPIIRAREGSVLYYTGHSTEAARVLEDAIAADSGNVFARTQLAPVYAELGNCRAAQSMDADHGVSVGQLERSFAITARARCGDTTLARTVVSRLESSAAHGGHVDPYAAARLYAALGDTARMWPLLQRAVASRVWELWLLDYDPVLAPYRTDPKFRTLHAEARAPLAASRD